MRSTAPCRGEDGRLHTRDALWRLLGRQGGDARVNWAQKGVCRGLVFPTPIWVDTLLEGEFPVSTGVGTTQTPWFDV